MTYPVYVEQTCHTQIKAIIYCQLDHQAKVTIVHFIELCNACSIKQHKSLPGKGNIYVIYNIENFSSCIFIEDEIAYFHVGCEKEFDKSLHFKAKFSYFHKICEVLNTLIIMSNPYFLSVIIILDIIVLFGGILSLSPMITLTTVI